MLNKVTLIGRLGADPEVTATASGVTITKFSLATTETFKSKDGGPKREETEWHRIVLFGRVAEIANQYLNKGDQVYLEGKNKTSKWQDTATGQDRYSTEVICHELKMLGSPSGPRSSASVPAQQQQQQAHAQQQQRYRQAPVQQQPTGQQQAYAQHSQQDDPFATNSKDGDIPF